MNAKVPEDGVGLPSAKELDVVFVDTCTEECGSSTRPKRAGAEEGKINASIGLEALGGVSKSGGDMCWLDGVPTFVIAVFVVVGIDHGVGRGGGSWRRVEERW